jgi:hypothetical protein
MDHITNLEYCFNTLTPYSHCKESWKVPVCSPINSMRQSLSWQANKSRAGQESPAFYRARRFISALTRVRYLALSCASHVAFVKDLKHRRFLWGDVVSTSHNPLSGGSPPVGCPRPPTQYIHSCPPYWRPFLHPQSEDAPYSGDRDPVIMGFTNRG